MSRKIGFFTVLTVMLLLLAGCNIKKKIGESITEKIIEKAAGDKNVDVDIDGDKITYKSDEGTVTIDENGTKVKSNSKNKDKDEESSGDDKKSGLGIFGKSKDNDSKTSEENNDAEDVTYDSDNNAEDVEVTNDNDTMKISSDEGDMIMSSEDKWPEGMAANKLPKFEKGVITYSINSPTGASITIEKVESDDAKAYIKEVKDAGYTDEAFEATSENGLTYSAKKDNVTVTVIYSSADKNLSMMAEVPAE